MQIGYHGLQQLVHFTFIMTFFGMTAGAFFFTLQSLRLRGSWAVAMILEAVVCLIAAMCYNVMKDIYAGLGGGIGTVMHRFPTEFRYIDWTLTVPLMLTQFPTILGMGRRGRQFLYMLVGLALVMLVTGFFGEIAPPGTTHLLLFAIGCAAWLSIIGLLFFGLSELPESVGDAKRAAIKRLLAFVVVGWCIYPLGYLAPAAGLAPDVRELVYNIGDLINKVGLGISVYTAAAAAHGSEDDGDDAPSLVSA